MEAAHRYALGNRHGVPSMSMFYQTREDSYYFTWALSQSWGQLFTTTTLDRTEREDLFSLERKFRTFEKENAVLLHNTRKQADLAFYLSLKTRDYIHNAASNNMKSLVAWMQSAYFTNQTFDIVFEDDSLETLQKYRILILIDLSMMSSSEMERVRDYAFSGGTVVATGTPGERDHEGKIRSNQEIARCFQLNSIPVAIEPVCEEADIDIHDNRGKIRAFKYTHRFLCEPNAVLLRTKSGIPVGIREETKKGKFLWMSLRADTQLVQHDVAADRAVGEGKRVRAPVYAYQDLVDGLGVLIQHLSIDPAITTEDWPDGWIVTSYRDQHNRLSIIHIVNTAGTLADIADTLVGHDDLIPGFVSSPESDLLPAMESKPCLRLRWDWGAEVTRIKLITPEEEGWLSLTGELVAGRLVILIPPRAFHGYALIQIS